MLISDGEPTVATQTRVPSAATSVGRPASGSAALGEALGKNVPFKRAYLFQGPHASPGGETWDALREAVFERTLKGLYDYDAAWTWALAMTPPQRAAMFADVVKSNR